MLFMITRRHIHPTLSLTERDCKLYYNVFELCPRIIGERERANLVVTFERNFLFIYIYAAVVRRVSAHARLLTRFFLSEIISKSFLTFSHTLPRDMI